MVEIDLPEYFASPFLRDSQWMQDPNSHIILCDEINLWLAQHRVQGCLGYACSRVLTRHEDGRRHTFLNRRIWIEFEDEQLAMLFKLTWL